MIWESGHIREGYLDRYPSDHPTGWIYEVVRIYHGKALFLAEHLDRMHQSAKYKTLGFCDDQTLCKGIEQLIKAEAKEEGNIRIQINSTDGLVIMGFIPHHYPSHKEKRTGIQVTTHRLVRDNPGIKSWNPVVRKQADAILQTGHHNEVLLVNDMEFITEGSRSNFFAEIDGLLVTPPIKSVLPGITRLLVMAIAQELKLTISERPIHLSEIPQMTAAFITGTSPGVLPIKQINSHSLVPNNKTTLQIAAAYQRLVTKQLQAK